MHDHSVFIGLIANIGEYSGHGMPRFYAILYVNRRHCNANPTVSIKIVHVFFSLLVRVRCHYLTRYITILRVFIFSVVTCYMLLSEQFL